MKNLLHVILILALCSCSGPQPSTTPAASAPATPPPVKAPDENAAISALREINEAQKAYFGRNRRYALDYEELTSGHFLKEEPAVSASGYEIKLRPSADAARYVVIAAPASNSSGARHFFTDQTTDIRAETGKDATAESPKI